MRAEGIEIGVSKNETFCEKKGAEKRQVEASGHGAEIACEYKYPITVSIIDYVV